MKNNFLKPVLVMVICIVIGASLVVSSKPVLGEQDNVPGPDDVFGTDENMYGPFMKIPDDYRLGAGDLVQVDVWKNEKVSGTFRVRPDGKFSMPLIGDVFAAGSTAAGISMQIEQKLKLFIESPYVSTILKEATSNRIYILGEVTNPGTYTLDGSLTALQALSLAGGFTTFAAKEKIVLVRGIGEMQKNISLSYSKMLRTPGEETNPVMERGDTLVVP
jgi:polysaccharide export outer membrane protein